MKAPDLVDKRQYPSVGQFLETQVEMQFSDLRLMLQLPLGDSKGPGCNFAAAAVLLHLLAGFSVCLFDASVKDLKSQSNRGNRFKQLLKKYYPWDGEQFAPTDGSEWLYKVIRNPMAHSLGVQVTAEETWSGIAKRSLSLGEVQKLEEDPERPVWVGQGGMTIFKHQVDSGQMGVFLSIPCLYWGVWRVLEKLCNDSDQMKKAEQALGQVGFTTVH